MDKEKHEIFDGVYCPLSSNYRVTGLHRTLVTNIKKVVGNFLVEVCDLDGGELYFGIETTSYSIPIIRLAEAVKETMGEDWEGRLYLVNHIKQYENPTGKCAWNVDYFTITSAPYTRVELDDDGGEARAIAAAERRITIAEHDFEEDSQFKTGQGPL